MNPARVEALMTGHDATLEVSDELLQGAIKSGFVCTADVEKIRDCNLIIENMKGNDTDLAKKITAASYTLRGVCYYNLLRNFCEPWDGNASGKLRHRVV